MLLYSRTGRAYTVKARISTLTSLDTNDRNTVDAFIISLMYRDTDKLDVIVIPRSRQYSTIFMHSVYDVNIK